MIIMLLTVHYRSSCSLKRMKWWILRGAGTYWHKWSSMISIIKTVFCPLITKWAGGRFQLKSGLMPTAAVELMHLWLTAVIRWRLDEEPDPVRPDGCSSQVTELDLKALQRSKFIFWRVETGHLATKGKTAFKRQNDFSTYQRDGSERDFL